MSKQEREETKRRKSRWRVIQLFLLHHQRLELLSQVEIKKPKQKAIAKSTQILSAAKDGVLGCEALAVEAAGISCSCCCLREWGQWHPPALAHGSPGMLL